MIKFPRSEKAALALGLDELINLRTTCWVIALAAFVRGDFKGMELPTARMRKIDQWLVKMVGQND